MSRYISPQRNKNALTMAWLTLKSALPNWQLILGLATQHFANG
jgi:hypothetical protein